MNTRKLLLCRSFFLIGLFMLGLATSERAFSFNPNLDNTEPGAGISYGYGNKCIAEGEVRSALNGNEDEPCCIGLVPGGQGNKACLDPSIVDAALKTCR